MPDAPCKGPATDAAPAKPSADVRVASTRESLGAARLLHIEHNGETCTPRLTRNDRLILTK